MGWLNATLQRVRLGPSSATSMEAADSPGHQRRMRKCLSAATIVLSFPKSGRTWHRTLLGSYLAYVTGASSRDVFELERLCKKTGVPPIAYTHGGAAFNDGLPAAHPSVAHAGLFAGKRVLLLVRDPRDVLVSAFFHARDRDRTWDGSLGDFVRGDTTGIEKLLVAHQRWFEAAGSTTHFEIMGYEEIHADPAAALRRTLRFVGLRDVEDTFVEQAVAFSRFDNMRALEERSFFAHEAMRRVGTSSGARKVRSGRVGGYRQHLSPEDLALIDAAIVRIGGPIAELYGPPALLATA